MSGKLAENFCIAALYISNIKIMQCIKQAAWIIPTKINIIKLTKLFFIKIILKFNILDNIIIDKGSIFTSTF